MLIEHDGRIPTIDPTAYIAPTAVICGDVSIGPNTCVGFRRPPDSRERTDPGRRPQVADPCLRLCSGAPALMCPG